jgi:Domain of Unknown Function with PDB structure (DUF3857)/Protein of unknown function (DUF2569)
VKSLSLLIVALMAGLCSTASGPINIKPDPAWVLPSQINGNQKPDTKNVSGGYYFDLMDHQINLEKQTIYTHIIRHIVNESGVQDASEVSVTFSPQYQQVVFHKINIIRGGRMISQLNLSAIKTADEESEASSYVYNGTRRVFVILKNVLKGDQIDFSYSVIGFNPVFKGLFSDEHYFYNSTAISNYYLSYIASAGRKLYFKLFNNAPAPTEQKSETQIIYQWKNPPIENGEISSDIPSWYTNSPYVTVTEFKDWKQVNDWALSVFSYSHQKLPERLLQKMTDWKKISNGDQDMFANLALRYVQDQIRYVGIEIGSNSHQPHSPEKVFDQGFGDCKDKALLLTTILDYEKIEAYVALVNTQERENLSQDAPSALAFNHAIVALKRGNSFIFVNPTNSLQRGELINNYIPAYGWALIVQPDGQQLTAVEPGFLHYSNIVEELTVSLEDSSYLNVTSEYKGGAADEMRNNISESSMKEMRESYVHYYSQLFEGLEMDSTISIEDDSIKNTIKVLESYKIPKIWTKNKEAKKQVDTYAKLVALKLPDPTDHKVKDPISLQYPCTLEYTLNMTMPDDWPLDMVPVHIKNESYQFDFTPSGIGKHLLFKYYFKSFRDYIPADEVAQYKEDYKEISSSLNLIFTSGDISTPPSQHKNFKPDGNTNWITIWICFFACVLMTTLFRYLNRKSILSDEYSNDAVPIQGWVILLAITLGFRFLYQAYIFTEQNYFNVKVWKYLGKNGGSTLKFVLIFEMCVALFSMAGSLSLLYWFFKKRDIFPFMFVRFVIVLLAAQLVLVLSYYNVNTTMDLKSVREDAITQLTRSCIYAFIWISFVLKSERVKQIFVYPHS